jgi:Carboxypeptidase regulatory-like domain
MTIRIMPSPLLSLSRLPFFLAAFILALPSAKAVCPVPEIPANSEFFKRDLVFRGTVLSVRELPDTDAAIGGWLYQVKVEKVFRGVPRSEVEVFTENSSGRFPLDKNRDYLLFADRRAGRFEIDNCGNSAPISEAADSLERLNRLLVGKQPTEVEGWVVGETSDVNVSGVRVTLRGRYKTYSATTGKDGRFQIGVPPGRYSVVPNSKQYYLNGGDLFWYDPDHFRLHSGECAVVQLVSVRHSGG